MRDVKDLHRRASYAIEDLRGFGNLKVGGREECHVVDAEGLSMATYYIRISPKIKHITGQVVFSDRPATPSRALWGICRAASVDPMNCSVFFDTGSGEVIPPHASTYLVLEEGSRGLEVLGFCNDHVDRAFRRSSYRAARQFGRCARRDCVWLPDTKHSALCADDRRPYQSISERVAKSVEIHDPESIFLGTTKEPAHGAATGDSISPLKGLFREESRGRRGEPIEPIVDDEAPAVVDAGLAASAGRSAGQPLAGELAMGPDDFGALASPTRVEILRMLGERKLTLTDISKGIARPKSGTSKHLAVLLSREMIEKLDEGRKWIYYQLSPRGRAILSAASRMADDTGPGGWSGPILDASDPEGSSDHHRSGSDQKV